MVKNACRSSRGLEFRFQLPRQVTHNCLFLQLYADLTPSLPSALMCTWTQTHILMLTLTFKMVSLIYEN